MSKALNKQRQLATSALRGKEMCKSGKREGTAQITNTSGSHSQ